MTKEGENTEKRRGQSPGYSNVKGWDDEEDPATGGEEGISTDKRKSSRVRSPESQEIAKFQIKTRINCVKCH